jgi:DNA repair protein RadD
MLREYQSRTIDQLYAWFEAGNAGNPCLVLPTGSGKSHIVAALCKDAVQNWPETVVLMLTHVKELIEQNAEKMRQHWPGAPLGIYSASIGRKDLGEPITFAGIQSVRNKAKQLGHVDLVIIDECHLVNHKDEGGYRKLLGELKAINPHLRVIGLTATPYRLGHGLITDEPALFDDLLEPVSIEELVFKGYLATLRSKITKAKLDTTGVHKRGGEFIESELQAAVDTKENNERVVREIVELADERKAWLVFCTGVQHAEHIASVLRQNGVMTECVLGETPKKERERIIADFKAGRIRALTNANVLTTGFDYPDIDLIAMLRPTMSASLYVQMAGRGMRVKSHTDHCLVLDFAGVVASHGPITNVQISKKAALATERCRSRSATNAESLSIFR